MEIQFDHNKVLKKIAKERLTPFGIFQQGNSRTFLFDNGWWTIIIEFQPSRNSKGSYLNVGIDFNFYPRDYFAFSHGYREKGFEEFKSEEQLKKIIDEYCDFIIKKVAQLQSKFKDVFCAIQSLNKQGKVSGWDCYDLGVLHGLSGNLKQSRKYLENLIKEKCEYPYEFERQKFTSEILSWLTNYDEFLDKMDKLIRKTREMKKLDETIPINIQQIKGSKRGILTRLFKT